MDPADAPSDMQPVEPPSSYQPLYELLFSLCVPPCSDGDVGPLSDGYVVTFLLAREAAGAAISALRLHAAAALPEHRGRLESLSASPWCAQDAATVDFVASCGSSFADWEVLQVGNRRCCCHIINAAAQRTGSCSLSITRSLA